MARSQNKSDYECILAKLLKAAVDSPANLGARRDCEDGGVLDLIINPRLRLDQMSTRK